MSRDRCERSPEPHGPLPAPSTQASAVVRVQRSKNGLRNSIAHVYVHSSPSGANAWVAIGARARTASRSPSPSGAPVPIPSRPRRRGWECPRHPETDQIASALTHRQGIRLVLPDSGIGHVGGGRVGKERKRGFGWHVESRDRQIWRALRHELLGPLPDRDMAAALAREGLPVPVAPPIAESHPGKASHEVQL